MTIIVALIYWVIVALWLAVLATVIVAFARNPRTFGAARLLLTVVAIDTCRNLVENLYFGLYFGSQFGFFPSAIIGVLGNPMLMILPKVINVIAASAVFGILLWRWLPAAVGERAAAEADIRQTSEALKQETEERRHLFETSLDLILVADRHGRIVRVSPSSAATLGYSPEEMTGREAIDFVCSDDLEPTRTEMRLVRGGQHTRNFEVRFVRKDGRIVTLAWSAVWSEPEQKYFLIGRDMTERRLAEEKLKQLAHYDHLTGLPNRGLLQNELGELMKASARLDCLAPSIAMLDLDDFKDINDTLGHSIGDQLLQEVAQRLVITADGDARAYRIGGDEFVLLFPGCSDPRIIGKVMESVLHALAERFELGEHQLFISASAGVAIAPADGSSVEDLISNADLALYDAKSAGGGTYRLFLPILRAKAQARRELDTEIRRASSENEFVLYFQPQLRLSDGLVVGAEALLRWRHPVRGILGPGAFIEALAESPVVLDVGKWILNTACEAAAGWHRLGLRGVRIGVNLFPAQCRGGILQQDVEAALLQSGLPPEALELEITENIAFANDDAMLASLRALREKGVGLAFDDFGTGYASLSYLTRYPLTRIKIDQSFLRKLTGEPTCEDSAVLRSIIAIAHNLGLEVIAEGIETPTQAAFLRDENCEEVQGFLYAKPLPAAEFEGFLRASHNRASSGQKSPGRMAG